jgi:hypothetical protein
LCGCFPISDDGGAGRQPGARRSPDDSFDWSTTISEKHYNNVHLNVPRGFNEPVKGAYAMTATKAAGRLAVLESGFRIIPGNETDFLAYQATVLPLAMAQDGFRSVYIGPVWDSTWVYFGARFDSEEQMNAWHGEPQHRVIQKSAPNWWRALYLRKWRPRRRAKSWAIG